VTEAGRFALRGVAYGLGLFGLLRLNWVEVHALVPFTGAQAAVAVKIFGPSATPLAVTLACSGVDALTLCLGAVLAYPARWPSRLAGVSAGLALVIGLNIVRLGTLGLASGLPAWFKALHLYIWPALLTLAVTAYVFAWMHVADRGSLPGFTARIQPAPPDAQPAQTRRFVVLAVTLMILFLAASPLYLQSAGVLALAGFIARSSAALLDRIGVEAHATSNVLWTTRGGFLVTQECISTPLIPIYLAAAIAYAKSRRRLIVALLAAGPLFVLLGIARLLVVAVPGMVTDAPLFLVHAFYQLLLAAVVVFIAARWQHDRDRSWYYAIAGIGAGIAFFYVVGPPYTRFITAWTGLPIEDPQGAIAVLPAFQVALFLALWVAACLVFGWRRFVAGLALLEVTQAAGLLLLHAVASHPGLTAHVRDIRGWAVVGPLLIVAVVVNVAAPRR
jgi:exosortase/archaeosortase family protein